MLRIPTKVIISGLFKDVGWWRGCAPFNLVLGAKRMGHLVLQYEKRRKEKIPIDDDKTSCVCSHGPEYLSVGPVPGGAAGGSSSSHLFTAACELVYRFQAISEVSMLSNDAQWRQANCRRKLDYAAGSKFTFSFLSPPSTFLLSAAGHTHIIILKTRFDMAVACFSQITWPLLQCAGYHMVNECFTLYV
jgi:hypothetical protein